MIIKQVQLTGKKFKNLGFYLEACEWVLVVRRDLIDYFISVFSIFLNTLSM